MANDRKKLEELTEENFVEKAESAISTLKDRKQKNGRPATMLTTTQIRNLLAMNADIYNEVMQKPGERLTQHVIERVNYLQVRFVYQAGREPLVRDFMEETELIDYIKDIRGNRKKYLLFCKYMEALVAYHRFYGGKD